MKAFLLIVLLVSLLASGVHAQTTDYSLEKLLNSDSLQRPIYLTHAGDERLFVVEQPGRIRIYENGELLETPFLDITTLVNDRGNEQGLLSIAFEPNYAETGRFYVNYTASDGSTRVVRYWVSDDPNIADIDSADRLLDIDQPYANHNGGQLQFGPDGYLYVGMGDGGSAGDPDNNGQNLGTLLGAMLRIDVTSEEFGYTVPADNPFVDNPDAQPEIWSYGLRNPWRFSFDRETGDLYMGDVGQNAYEEINFQPADSTGGENYGWRFFVGNEPYLDDTPNESELVFPISVYSHQVGCSVTGGYVYRGAALPDLEGRYFFADYCAGTIWTLIREGEEWIGEDFMQLDTSIASFGEDLNGELYVMGFGGETGIWKLVAGE